MLIIHMFVLIIHMFMFIIYVFMLIIHMYMLMYTGSYIHGIDISQINIMVEIHNYKVDKIASESSYKT